MTPHKHTPSTPIDTLTALALAHEDRERRMAERWTTVHPADGSPAYRRPTIAALADGLNDSTLWDGQEPRRMPI